MDRTARLLPLGPHRLRLLECLGGNDPRTPGYFAPESTANVFDAFGQYIKRLSALFAAERDPLVVSLLAAARLLTGDLRAADVILDHVPNQPQKLDHGAGMCLVMPVHALATALPLPAALTDTSRWFAGSPAQAALRTWLASHRNELRWLESEGKYQLGGR